MGLADSESTIYGHLDIVIYGKLKFYLEHQQLQNVVIVLIMCFKLINCSLVKQTNETYTHKISSQGSDIEQKKYRSCSMCTISWIAEKNKLHKLVFLRLYFTPDRLCLISIVIVVSV